MARQFKPEQHAARRGEIIGVALQLLHDKGYERTTIDDVLTSLAMSKGAFYHYFGSKQALLDGVVDHLGERAVAQLGPIVTDPELPALDKLRAYLATSAQWKSDNAQAVQVAIRLWRDEGNALLRMKLAERTMASAAPLLASVIEQGCEEGVFDTGHPAEAAAIITGMGLQLADRFVDALRADGATDLGVGGKNTSAVVAAYYEAYERILGLPPRTLDVVGSQPG